MGDKDTLVIGPTPHYLPQEAIFVNLQSQYWIYFLYALLRTILTVITV